ncbi:MAG TPA: ComEC/Rec2 family competence protein [Flavobacterium sp.]|jgi:competence protein ComEC
MKVLRFPLARITFWFIAGIIAAYFLHPDPFVIFLSLAVSFAALLLFYTTAGKHLFRKNYFGALLYFVMILCGAATFTAHSEQLQASNYIHFTKSGQQLLHVTLREKLKGTVSSERYYAEVSRIGPNAATGRILINFQKAKSELHVGENLIVRTEIIKHRRPLNPNQFDYGKYLTNKSVYAQVYVYPEDVRIFDAPKKDIWYYSDRFRNRIIDNLKKSGFNQQELNVAAALILGQQQDISPEILQDYQFAGAVHILSVSGLHVGFLLLFLNFILKPLPKTRRGSIIKLITIIGFLWLFAIVAGLSPSVVRSTTMFSFVAIGMHLNRSTNIFHTLVVSMLLILLFEPAFLFDVGFQLSYAALFFILWLQPYLAQLWMPENKMVKYFWDILTVSFAGQIGTLPLSVYYFHQFPGLFFITNLVVIPFLSFIMIAGVLVMVPAALGFTFPLATKILEWSIFVLNKIIGLIASFENFIFRDIPFNSHMLVTSYLLIIALIFYYAERSKRNLTFLLCSIACLQTAFLVEKWTNNNDEELVVFNIRNRSMITERHGQAVKVFADTISNERSEKALQQYLTANFSRVSERNLLRNTLSFKEQKILIIDSSAVYPLSVNPDIIVLTQSPRINVDRMLAVLKPKMVIADASNYKSYTAMWDLTCQKQKIPFHFTGEKGFFRLIK